MQQPREGVRQRRRARQALREDYVVVPVGWQPQVPAAYSPLPQHSLLAEGSQQRACVWGEQQEEGLRARMIAEEA